MPRKTKKESGKKLKEAVEKSAAFLEFSSIDIYSHARCVQINVSI